MSNVTVKELTAYLKEAVVLESSIYRQQQAYWALQEVVQSCAAPVKETISKPYKAALPEKPQSPSGSPEQKILLLKKCVFYGVFSLIIALISVIGAAVTEVPLLFIIAVCAGVICFGAALQFSATKKEISALQTEKDAYASAIKDYEQQVSQIEQNYEAKLKEYQARQAVLESNYEKAANIYQKQMLSGKQAMAKMNEQLMETRKILRQFYAVGWIFPKYRDLVAVTTIYEYFSSGRCTGLTGPSGAYNLYEAELRQNLIIGRLDTIIHKLDQIRQTQYVLYNELRETNRIIRDIRADVSKSLSTAEDIAKSVHLTAQYAKITAQNTEALKYISLISK